MVEKSVLSVADGRTTAVPPPLSGSRSIRLGCPFGLCMESEQSGVVSGSWVFFVVV